MKRSTLTQLGACALWLAASHAAAQATEAAATPPAAVTPAAAPAAENTARATSTTPAAAAPVPAPASATEATPAGAPAAAVDSEDPEQAERQRQADRARLRLVLARARAERAATTGQPAQPIAVEPAPQPEREYGDAAAAIAVAVSLETPWNHDIGFDLFSDDDVSTRFGLWATYDLLAIHDDVFVAAGAGVDFESLDENNLLSGQLSTDLDAVIGYATAVVRYVPVAWLQPHVRLSGGAERVIVKLDFAGERFRDEGTLPFASLGAGITLRSPTRMFESRRGTFAALSFGLMIEGGYALVSPLQVTLDGEGPAERDIALEESELGELERSGPFMRVSLVARF